MLPTPDHDAATWLAKLAGFAATAIAGAFAIFKMIDKKIEKKAAADVVLEHATSISTLTANQRADKIELHAAITHRADQLASSIATLSETQRRDRDTILMAIREDRADMHAALGGIKDALSNFKTEVIHELGIRPTRQEVNEVLFQTPRPRGKI